MPPPRGSANIPGRIVKGSEEGIFDDSWSEYFVYTSDVDPYYGSSVDLSSQGTSGFLEGYSRDFTYTTATGSHTLTINVFGDLDVLGLGAWERVTFGQYIEDLIGNVELQEIYSGVNGRSSTPITELNILIGNSGPSHFVDNLYDGRAYINLDIAHLVNLRGANTAATSTNSTLQYSKTDMLADIFLTLSHEMFHAIGPASDHRYSTRRVD